eukprot:c8913_g1_i2.p1 GENE.c8913_g1_i2~~c8913_g1_i2.p1  ORF type:complete len:256 (-),score=26.92 c8913_g1_i2:26-793(-)
MVPICQCAIFHIGFILIHTTAFAVTAIYPTRGSIQGGTTVHVCGFGFQAHDNGRFGEVEENRIYCFFRLNQTRMKEIGAFYGLGPRTDHEFYDNDHWYSTAGIYKTSTVKRISPGGIPSFKTELTATEEFYSKFLTSRATFVNDQEITCETPDISDIPIGFPVVAEVGVSINGKEQFFVSETAFAPEFTFYDQRSTRDGLSTVHTYKSKLGRKIPSAYKVDAEEDLSIIRRITPDTYTGKFTGLYDEVVDSQGEI